MKIAVIGSGSFGTAVASMLLNAGHSINIWCHSESVAKSINDTGRNSKHMQNCKLDGAFASTDFESVLKDSQAFILATPSFAVRKTVEMLAEFVPQDAPGLLLSKGLGEDGSLLYEQLASALDSSERVAVLSGPNHAEEIALGKFAGAVVASTSRETALVFQQAISSSAFRLYTSNDPIGVSLCGAIKNIVAIACGMARGLDLGDNTISLLITRGLAETSRLVEACGGDRLTCLGLAGVGDLNATCNSRHSRNGMYGETFAKEGMSVCEYERSRNAVVEGAHAVKSILLLAKKHGVEMPISQTIYDLLYDDLNISKAVKILIERELTEE